MNYEEQIKFDLGICADTLIASFISNNINKTVGIIYFMLGLLIPVIKYLFKKEV